MKMPEWLEATDSGTEGKIRGREHFLIRNRSALEAVINSFSSERFELRFCPYTQRHFYCQRSC